jgi:hypothetical protein
VLGDLCDVGSLDTVLYALGVGLAGRGARLDLPEPNDEDCCCGRSRRMLYEDSSRLVVGLMGYGWLISTRPGVSADLLSSLLRL